MVSKTQFVKKNEGPPLVFQCKTKRNRNSTKVKCSKTKQRMENYCLIIILNLASSLKNMLPFPLLLSQWVEYQCSGPWFTRITFEQRSFNYTPRKLKYRLKIDGGIHEISAKILFSGVTSPFLLPILVYNIFKPHQFSGNSPFQSSISVLALLMGNIPHSCGTYEIFR